MFFLIEEYRTDNKEGIYFSRPLTDEDLEFHKKYLNCCFTLGKDKLIFPDGVFTYESTIQKEIKNIKKTVMFLLKHTVGLKVFGKICISFLSLEGIEEYILTVKDSSCYLQERLLKYSEEQII